MVISGNISTTVLAVGIGVGTTPTSTVVEVPFEVESVSAKYRHTSNSLTLCPLIAILPFNLLLEFMNKI